MRTQPIKDPELKNTYLMGLYENDDDHPNNERYGAILRFDGLSEVPPPNFA